jgi:hypothetical protein
VTCRDPATPHVLKTRAHGVMVEGRGMRPHAYHNPVLLTSPLCRPGDQVRVNIRSQRGCGVRAPGQQRIYAAGAYYPGLPLLGPVCIRPPPLHSPVSNPGPPEAGMCTTRMQRLEATFRTPWLLPCECWAVACARVCGPGGIGPGYVCRTEE